MAAIESTPESEKYLSLERNADGNTRFATAEALDIPVDGGTVRVYHVPPAEPETTRSEEALRPVVFVSGWGTIPTSFSDFYGAVPAQADIYHVETREKSSSVIVRRGSVFTMDRIAADVRDVMTGLGLSKRDPVLMGTCFGSAVILHGLARDILRAPTVVCMDPMDRLWFPRWLINVLRPIMPAAILWLFRPPMRAIVLAGMKEPVQRKRAKDFIDSATIWKWRKAAVTVRNWDFFELAHRIRQRVYVVNGSHDRFHNSEMFPKMARSIPDGRFVLIPVGESRRERLMGVTAGVFAAADPGDTVPEAIVPFVAT